MAEKIIAWIAMAAMVAFMGFLAIYINEIDLWIIIVGVLALGIADFYLTLHRPSDKTNQG